MRLRSYRIRRQLQQEFGHGRRSMAGVLSAFALGAAVWCAVGYAACTALGE